MPKATRALRERWARGETTANAWLTLADPMIAETASHAGFDSLCIDMQHGLIDHGAALQLLRATSASGLPTLVRVPWNQPSDLMRVLDAGAHGVIVPMIDTPEQAAQLVESCLYPPLGQRSNGPIRASVVEEGYFERANDELLLFAMIETRGALEQLDAILATPGLSGVYIGPTDLGLALGLPPEMDSQRPEHQATVRHIIDRAHAHGLIAGLHCASAGFARLAAGWGADLVTIAADLPVLRQALAQRVAEFHQPDPR